MIVTLEGVLEVLGGVEDEEKENEVEACLGSFPFFSDLSLEDSSSLGHRTDLRGGRSISFVCRWQDSSKELQCVWWQGRRAPEVHMLSSIVYFISRDLM